MACLLEEGRSEPVFHFNLNIYLKFFRMGDVMKRSYVSVLIAPILILGFLSLFSWGKFNLSLDKERLDLPFIINYVDEQGEGHFQLNWQEIVALIAMDQTKDLSQISSSDLDEAITYFTKDGVLHSFEQVLEIQEYSEVEKERAYQNLSTLSDYGYVPNKLKADSFEMTFINSLKEGAIENYRLYGILPSITIAQAILESNFGQSELSLEANNLFGIKVGLNWEGEAITVSTMEGYNTEVMDDFRSYDSVSDSLIDHGHFLANNPRYTEHGVFEAKTYREQAKALENAGYRTAVDEQGNKTYAKRIGELIRQYNLQLIDHSLQVD